MVFLFGTVVGALIVLAAGAHELVRMRRQVAQARTRVAELEPYARIPDAEARAKAMLAAAHEESTRTLVASRAALEEASELRHRAQHDAARLHDMTTQYRVHTVQTLVPAAFSNKDSN